MIINLSFLLFCSEFNVKSEYIYADMTKTSDIEQFCQTIKSNHKNGIDILVNNAGNVINSSSFPCRKYSEPTSSARGSRLCQLRLLKPGWRTLRPDHSNETPTVASRIQFAVAGQRSVTEG